MWDRCKVDEDYGSKRVPLRRRSVETCDLAPGLQYILEPNHPDGRPKTPPYQPEVTEGRTIDTIELGTARSRGRGSFSAQSKVMHQDGRRSSSQGSSSSLRSRGPQLRAHIAIHRDPAQSNQFPTISSLASFGWPPTRPGGGQSRRSQSRDFLSEDDEPLASKGYEPTRQPTPRDSNPEEATLPTSHLILSTAEAALLPGGKTPRPIHTDASPPKRTGLEQRMEIGGPATLGQVLGDHDEASRPVPIDSHSSLELPSSKNLAPAQTPQPPAQQRKPSTTSPPLEHSPSANIHREGVNEKATNEMRENRLGHGLNGASTSSRSDKSRQGATSGRPTEPSTSRGLRKPSAMKRLVHRIICR